MFLQSEVLEQFCQENKQIKIHKLILSPVEENRTSFWSGVIWKNKQMDIKIKCKKFLTHNRQKRWDFYYTSNWQCIKSKLAICVQTKLSVNTGNLSHIAYTQLHSPF